MDKIQNGSFLLLLLGTSLLFAWVIHGFAYPIFWAVLLAVVFYPVYARLLIWMNYRAWIASLLTLLIIVLCVVIPATFLGVAVMQEALDLYERIVSGQIQVQEAVDYIQSQVPVVTEILEKAGVDWQKIKQGLSQTALHVSQLVATNLVSIGQNAFRFGAMTLIMLYLLYFFFKDGRWLVQGIIRALPLGDRREEDLFARFAEVSRATMKGTFVVAVIQGGLGGILFWIMGIQAALFWGVVMTILSLLPVLGSALVWGPAAVILISTGHIVKGVLLLGFGSVVIGLADNLLRPILVGRETRLPDYIVLISTLGGLSVFGVSGFIIGPVVAALFLTVWEMFGQEFGREEDFQGDSPESGLE